MQRETLEIWARLGIGDAVAARGVQWRIGRTYHRGRLLFETRLPDQPDEHFPPFVNISQSEVEEMLAGRLDELGVDVRHGHRLTGLAQDGDGVTATFDTDGESGDGRSPTSSEPMAPIRRSGTWPASASMATRSTTGS